MCQRRLKFPISPVENSPPQNPSVPAFGPGNPKSSNFKTTMHFISRYEILSKAKVNPSLARVEKCPKYSPHAFFLLRNWNLQIGED